MLTDKGNIGNEILPLVCRTAKLRDHPAQQQVRRKTVPQRVRRHFFPNPGQPRRLLKLPAHLHFMDMVPPALVSLGVARAS